TYRNWEVLVWDNGSADGTIEELHRWIPHRLPGRVVIDRPMGLGASLAAMVEESRTEWCARIDADDVNEPQRLERQMQFVQHHSQIGLLGTSMTLVGINGEPLEGGWDVVCGDAEIRWALRWRNCFNHPTVLFRRSAVIQAGNYHDCMPFEDYDLWMRMLPITSVGNLSEKFVRYRIRENSVTASLSHDFKEIDNEVALRNAASLFPGLSAEQAISWRKKFQRHSQNRVDFSDLWKMPRIAASAARSIDKPPSYFRRTKLYRRQRLVLLYKLLRQCLPGRKR
ncbi:MAG TPA: glycosyltransferase, partial [Abditibacteriaceae bacterium]